MKATTLALFTTLIVVNSLFCQQQIQNPGFEEWEDAGTVVDEPTNWSSIKTSDDIFYNNLAPVVWEQSNDAHSGAYSLGLFNVGSLVIATGMITNGRVHTQLPADSSYVFTDLYDERWHSTLTERPDSVAGWFKCNPSGSDFGTVKFLLHTGYAQLPGDETNHIAMAYYELPSEEITQWTRFSAPFIYSSNNNPEYYLSVLTSGNGTQAVIGSTALFDDLEFIYNENSVAELSENQFKVRIVNNNLDFIIESNNNELYEFKLIDVNGRIILTKQINAGENNSINISEFQSGLYIVIAVNPRKTFTKKVLIN